MIRFSRTWIREAGMAVAITRTDLSAADLRREAARTRDAKTARRMLAIALVLEGRPRGGGPVRHGPAGAARLGAPLQRRGHRGPVRPAGPPRPEALPVAGAGGRGGTVGRGGGGPRRARRGWAPAPPPSSRPPRTALRAAAA